MGMSVGKRGLFGLELTGSKRPFEWNNLSVFGILQRPRHITPFLKHVKAFVLSRAAWVWGCSNSSSYLVHTCQVV